VGERRRRGNMWWIRYYRNGRRSEESANSDKKRVAIELLKIREGDGAKGLPVTPRIGRLLFEEAAAIVAVSRNLRGQGCCAGCTNPSCSPTGPSQRAMMRFRRDCAFGLAPIAGQLR
jgi:hypothetical protein